jgi:single-strand DNA-binding protein
MSRSINKSILLGNVGKDPDIRTTQGGAIIANFSIATEDKRKDAQGNWQAETEWHNCVAFKRTAEIVRDYVRKGSKVYVEGKGVTESWDDKQTGAKRYAHKIVVFELILLSGKDEQNKASNTTTTAPDESETITDLDVHF